MTFNPAFERAVSKPRFDRFRASAQDDQHAWELYRWNIELTQSFTPVAADLEIALRNTIHDHLTDLFGSQTWWTNPKLLLDDITTSMLTHVVSKYRKSLDRGQVGAGKVISELSLGRAVAGYVGEITQQRGPFGTRSTDRLRPTTVAPGAQTCFHHRNVEPTRRTQETHPQRRTRTSRTIPQAPKPLRPPRTAHRRFERTRNRQNVSP